MSVDNGRTFKLPKVIAALVIARNAVRTHYGEVLARQGNKVELAFTLDGNLVGDIGEALAVELFGVQLVETKSTEGIDGKAPDGRTVQVKATGTGRGPAFRCTDKRADHLLFFDLDLEQGNGMVVFNGPEHYARRPLPAAFKGQRSVSRSQISKADLKVAPTERLARVDEIAAAADS
ncbi:hypothetical protein PbB2_02760 [Candidatus Phycosocius bacilliformis]|uniref:DUF6998 domain-containing protein n=1 Tax=Candidatus Phycosocius bacilliformis TaxID=1445552 RepID=A0A2P2EDD1_9PROT|nr:hypothetical protein [Candidatus Phycosocius bacilliformis]GBF59068.1 hypothetical protein PbB2_02760 [Candidatus Phycosocius bacilliformis]